MTLGTGTKLNALRVVEVGNSFIDNTSYHASVNIREITRLGLENGATVSITGKRRTVAKLVASRDADASSGAIYLGPLIIQNARAAAGYDVMVAPVSPQSAAAIVLMYQNGGVREKDSEALRHALLGYPMVVGDKVVVALNGSGPLEFEVGSTTPEGVVIIDHNTTIGLTQALTTQHVDSSITFEHIGGLSAQVEQVREVVELPLKYPEIFERLGIAAPKGVLLYGPPGCGKTLIARAVANETSAYYIAISGPEIVHKYYGDSEAHLREVFSEAREHAPSIIFLDEIDAIAPRREDVYGEVEKRVVAQLMALLDGLESRGRVMLLAATNIPDALDPALRRPGRFDREIAIPVPDKVGRREILRIHTRNMPLGSDVDLDQLADITHGYVGADLEALSKEAAMHALRRAMPDLSSGEGEVTEELLNRLEVTNECFLEASRQLHPTILRDVSAAIPEVYWSDIGGLNEAKQALQETIEWPQKYEGLFQDLRSVLPKGILLYGLPGTGKTLLAQAAAKESGMNYISIKGPSLLSKWVGESEKGVRDIFQKARLAVPCILFFDEIDAWATTRGGAAADSGVTDRIISQFLTEMDALQEMKGVVVLAATNRPDLLEPAIVSPGRLEVLIEVPIPNREERLEIFRIHLSDKPVGKDVDVELLADLTDGLTGSDIAAICRRATMTAIRERVESGVPLEKDARVEVTTRHFRRTMSVINRKTKGAPPPSLSGGHSTPEQHAHRERRRRGKSTAT